MQRQILHAIHIKVKAMLICHVGKSDLAIQRSYSSRYMCATVLTRITQVKIYVD